MRTIKLHNQDGKVVEHVIGDVIGVDFKEKFAVVRVKDGADYVDFQIVIPGGVPVISGEEWITVLEDKRMNVIPIWGDRVSLKKPTRDAKKPRQQWTMVEYIDALRDTDRMTKLMEMVRLQEIGVPTPDQTMDFDHQVITMLHHGTLPDGTLDMLEALGLLNSHIRKHMDRLGIK